jgi:hypothetical protein
MDFFYSYVETWYWILALAFMDRGGAITQLPMAINSWKMNFNAHPNLGTDQK